MKKQDFELFFKANKRRIHYQMQRLGIVDQYNEFYTEGITALWKAYRDFDDSKGDIGTFLNYRIRFALIDFMRKENRKVELEEKVTRHNVTDLTDGTRHRHSDTPLPQIPSMLIHDAAFWDSIRDQLTEKQWKWVQYFIIADLSVQEIMELENVSEDAVKSWGRYARYKLKNDKIKHKLRDYLIT